MLTVKPREARRALWRAHGFDGSRRWGGKSGALAMFSRHPVVQSDPINVAGRNHDLTLQSRVKGYRPKHLDALLYKDRALFEYYCKMASILPMDAYPLFHELRERMAKRNRPHLRKHRKEKEEILGAIAAGPVSSRGFSGKKTDHWWGMTKVHRIVLESLFLEGRIVIHHREGGEKFYSLPEDAIPARLLEASPPSHEEYQLKKADLISRSMRIAAASGGPYHGFGEGFSAGARRTLERLEKEKGWIPVALDGWKARCCIPAEDEGLWRDPPEPSGGVRFIAPLDPLMWNRRLFREVYGREYVWEVYKRPHDRKFGYYCLPILWNGDFVGLFEPFLRKADRVLEIRSLHVFEGVDAKRLGGPLDDAISDFADYAGAERTERIRR